MKYLFLEYTEIMILANNLYFHLVILDDGLSQVTETMESETTDGGEGVL
jgi:hypothetical protein